MSTTRVNTLSDLKAQLLKTPPGTRVEVEYDLDTHILSQAIVKKPNGGGLMGCIVGARYLLADFKPDSDIAQLFVDVERETKHVAEYDDRDEVWFGFVHLIPAKPATVQQSTSEKLSEIQVKYKMSLQDFNDLIALVKKTQ